MDNRDLPAALTALIKDATRQHVRALGGVTPAAALIGRSEGFVSKAQRDGYAEILSLTDIVLLESQTQIPAFGALIAGLTGNRLADMDEGDAGSCVRADAQTSIDRLRNSVDAAAMSVGNLFEAFGASTAITDMARDVEQVASAVKLLRAGEISGAGEKVLQVLGETSADAAYADEYRRASGGREPSKEQIQDQRPMLAPWLRGTTEEADIAAARQAARDQVRDAGGVSAAEALSRMNAVDAEAQAARDAVAAAQAKVSQARTKADKRAAEKDLLAARAGQKAVEDRASIARAGAGAWAARDMVGVEAGREDADAWRETRRRAGGSYGADSDRLRELRAERAELTAAAIENGFGEKIDREIAEIVRRRAAGEIRRAPAAAPLPAESREFALPPRRGEAPADVDWQPALAPRGRPDEARPSTGRVQQYPVRPAAAAAPVVEQEAPQRASMFDVAYPSTPAPAPRVTDAAAATPRPVVEPVVPQRASMFDVEYPQAPVTAPEAREDPGLDRRQQQVEKLIATYRRLDEQAAALPEAPAGGSDPTAALRGQIEAQKFQMMNLLRQIGGDAAESFLEGIRSGASAPIELPKPEPVDLTAVGAETMRSFGAGLDGEMSAVRAKVQAFAAEIRGMLSISASPSINATVTTTERRRVSPVNADVGDSGKAFD